MTTKIATTATHITTKSVTGFLKSSLAVVAVAATLGTSLATTNATAENSEDWARGLAVVGGLIIGGAILHEVLDNNPNVHVQQVHHQPQPRPQPSYGHGNNQNGNGISKKRRNRLANKCSSAAVNDALASGYSNAWVKRVKSVERKGNGRFKVTGVIKQQFQQRAPRRNNGYRNARHWNNGNNGWGNNGNWGHNNQPRYVTYEEKRTFSCVVKNGQVRKLRKW